MTSTPTTDNTTAYRALSLADLRTEIASEKSKCVFVEGPSSTGGVDNFSDWDGDRHAKNVEILRRLIEKKEKEQTTKAVSVLIGV